MNPQGHEPLYDSVPPLIKVSLTVNQTAIILESLRMNAANLEQRLLIETTVPVHERAAQDLAQCYALITLLDAA